MTRKHEIIITGFILATLVVLRNYTPMFLSSESQWLKTHIFGILGSCALLWYYRRRKPLVVLFSVLFIVNVIIFLGNI